MNLKQYLQQKNTVPELISILEDLAFVSKEIVKSVRFSEGGKVGTKNVFGEEQIALDVLSNKIITEKLKENSNVGVVASEEMEGELKLGNGEYAVCYDPLDGSSLVDVNLSVGSIFGVYKSESFLGLKGDDQVAAMIFVYGPGTVMLLTLKNGVVKFRLDESGEFIFVSDEFKVKDGKMFAPGNLRACKYNEGYKKLMDYWCGNEYKLRYSGGMVPDIYQIIIKGEGIFAYPAYEKEPEGKLRLLYECAPMALLMEQAGGKATDGKLRILDKEIKSVDQKTPIFIGSEGEVKRCGEYLS